jgi:IS5 family transposase
LAAGFNENLALFEVPYSHMPRYHHEANDRLAEIPVSWHIALKRSKRKALPANRLGKLLEQLDRAKASIRAKVEHPFHALKNLFKHKKTRYRGLAKNEAQLLSLFGLANLFLARRPLLALHARGAS